LPEGEGVPEKSSPGFGRRLRCRPTFMKNAD